jgi:hypothetical protein
VKKLGGAKVFEPKCRPPQTMILEKYSLSRKHCLFLIKRRMITDPWERGTLLRREYDGKMGWKVNYNDDDSDDETENVFLGENECLSSFFVEQSNNDEVIS